jgi:hypothetical protein
LFGIGAEKLGRIKTQTPARTGTLAFGFEKRVSLLGRAGTWSFEGG